MFKVWPVEIFQFHILFISLPLSPSLSLSLSPSLSLSVSLSEPPELTGCYEPNLKLREAQRLYQDQLVGPESIANIGGQCVLHASRGRHTSPSVCVCGCVCACV